MASSRSDSLRRIRRWAVALVAALVLALPTAAEAGWSKQQLHVYQGIRLVFPKRYHEARRVFWCESRYNPWAQNGQYIGVPQLSASWRSYFLRYGIDASAGHWWEQLVAAHSIFRGYHFRWTAWSCQP